jgi:hypothetical protein
MNGRQLFNRLRVWESNSFDARRYPFGTHRFVIALLMGGHYVGSIKELGSVKDFALPLSIPILTSGLILLMGILTLLQNLDITVIREVSRVIWPLCLIATGLYGILLHNWRARER